LVPLGVDLDEVEPDTQMLVRPDFWPMIVGGLMVLIGTIYGMVSHLKLRAADSRTSDGESQVPQMPDFQKSIDPRRATAVIVVVLVFALSNDDTGMLLPAMAMFVVSAIGFGRGHMGYKMVGALVVPIILWQFFERVANIPIPLGVLENIFL